MKGLESSSYASWVGRINPRDINVIIFLVSVVSSIIIFFADKPYLKFIMMYFFAYSIYTASWDLLYSYSGQLSLGQALPFGLGAFFTIMFAQFANLPLVLSAILGTLAAGAVGGSIGATTIRLKPGYQGIAILLFSQVLYWLTLIAFGEEGVSFFSETPPSETTLYFTGLTLFVISMFTIYMIQNSEYKLKLLAIKGDNLAADVCGINVRLHKVILLYLSSLLAGLAGTYFGIFISHADFSIFAVPNSFLPIGMAIVGGIGFLGGPIIGAAIVTMIINILPVWYSLAITYFVYGIVVILILRLRPTGILGLLQRSVRKEKSKVVKS